MTEPRRDRIRWLPLLLEALFVVLGVALAYGANEWREARGRERAAETALDAVRREIVANRARVLGSLGYHLQLSDTLRRHVGVGLGPPSRSLFTRGYLTAAEPSATAWEVANATGTVTNMPYEDVLALSQIYDRQASYEQQADEAGRLLYGTLYAEGHAGVTRNYAGVATLIDAFWYTECRLVMRYDEALVLLGADVPDDLPEICHRLPAEP